MLYLNPEGQRMTQPESVLVSNELPTIASSPCPLDAPHGHPGRVRQELPNEPNFSSNPNQNKYLHPSKRTRTAPPPGRIPDLCYDMIYNSELI
jgi:hypothetical protein